MLYRSAAPAFSMQASHHSQLRPRFERMRRKTRDMARKRRESGIPRVIDADHIDLTRVDWQDEDWQALHDDTDWSTVLYDEMKVIDMDTKAWDLSRLINVVKKYLPPIAIKKTSTWVVIINRNITSASQIQSDGDFLFIKAHPRVCGATLQYYYHRSYPIQNLAILHNERILSDFVQVRHLKSTDGVVILRAVELAPDTKGNCRANPIEVASDSEHEAPQPTSSSSQASSSSKSCTSATAGRFAASPAASTSPTCEVLDLQDSKYAYPCPWSDLLNPDPDVERRIEQKLREWDKIAHTPEGGRGGNAEIAKKTRQTCLDGWLKTISLSEPNGYADAGESLSPMTPGKKRRISDVEGVEEPEDLSRKRVRPWLPQYFHQDIMPAVSDYPFAIGTMTDEQVDFEDQKCKEGYSINEMLGLRLKHVPQVSYRDTVTCSPSSSWPHFLKFADVDLRWSDLERRIESLAVCSAFKQNLRTNPRHDCGFCEKPMHMMPWTRFEGTKRTPLCTLCSRMIMHVWAGIIPKQETPIIDPEIDHPAELKFNNEVGRVWVEKHLKQMKLNQRLIMDHDNPGEPDYDLSPVEISVAYFNYNCWDHPESLLYNLAATPVPDSQPRETKESSLENVGDDVESFFSGADTSVENSFNKDWRKGERTGVEDPDSSSNSEPPSSPLVQRRHKYSESASSDDEGEFEMIDEQKEGDLADDEDDADWNPDWDDDEE